ncbi:MAG: hypothetical protein OXS29_11545 [bacterium]|nr:hypothetical protein [bacterium]
MDAALYKHAVLGLIFFKYVSSAFEETWAGLRLRSRMMQTPRIQTSTGLSIFLGAEGSAVVLASTGARSVSVLVPSEGIFGM